MDKAPKQLIVIGDSSAYGWGDVIQGGWCERLRRNWMKIEGAPIIYPLGIRGDGLEKVAKRWRSEWQCRGELRRNLPDALLLTIGINDTAKIGRKDGRPQLSSDAFKFGLGSLLREMSKEANVMVMGLTAVKESEMPFAKCLWYSNHACALYERQIEKSCLDFDIPFLPIHQAMLNEPLWETWLHSDGIHLNPLGHEWVYKKILNWPAMIKWSEVLLP
ncbi:MULTISPECIES: GDSL-type esterase/lipase family protein [Prochlorococcus]|uniref:GDSL-type esterase/lipase family protein n=1 Tax=Prochlorococcus TaxID=1218 RepID=UPI000533B030|nr:MULTISPECIES: GDSL-type esterase/lipase family protein [Prochlorococcus]KGG12560.1 hypothetical protein EV05_1772 [Prochlorococcus sp. MIT 0601]